MMKYLPFENIIYRTKLTPEEVVNKIREITEPRKAFRMSRFFGRKDHKPYEGSTNGMSFSINRVIGYQNSFLPRIHGIISTELDATKVEVKMRLHPLVLLFMLIWCGGVGLGLLAFLTSSVGKGEFEPAIFFPFGMLLFGYGLTTGGFKYESIKSRKYLTRLFEAGIEIK